MALVKINKKNIPAKKVRKRNRKPKAHLSVMKIQAETEVAKRKSVGVVVKLEANL